MSPLSDLLPPRSPLSPGSPLPYIPLSLADQEVLPVDLLGQTTILLFASTEWNPAHNEQMAQFYNALVRAVGSGTDVPTAPNDSLFSRRDDGPGYCLRFEGAPGSEPISIVVLPDINLYSEAARAFGVYGQEAVFVIDSEGIIRFRHLSESGDPSIGPLVDTLRELHTPPQTTNPMGWHATRRDFIAAALAGAFALTLGIQKSAEAKEEFAQETTKAAPPGTIPVTLKVNGKRHTMNLDPRTTLLDALRENMGMTGSKKGCDHGQCGACTVHIDGQRSLSCLALAAQQDGSDIVTIEGLARGDNLHPVQQAFLDHDGYQCGYCTPGQIMSAVALLREGHAKTDAEIREGMSGNLCRCAAYPHIVAAVKAARDSGKRI